MPDQTPSDEKQTIRRLLAAQRIAIVGLSDDSGRPSHTIGSYLQSLGREIIPVNPRVTEALGVAAYPSLLALPGPVDLVNVFRRAEFCLQIVRDAIQIGAAGVWLQSGIVSDEAARLAREAGLDFVQDQCIMVELMRG